MLACALSAHLALVASMGMSAGGVTDSVLASDWNDSSTTIVEDASSVPGWNFEAQGSLWAGGGALKGNSASFVKTMLGSDPASSRLQAWSEMRVSANRSWASDNGRWVLQAHAAPLVGGEGLDSASKRTRTLIVLREGWLRMGWEGDRRIALWSGSMRIEPGAGLSAHPSRVSPLVAGQAQGADESQERNPVGIGLEGAWADGVRTAVQVYPELSPDKGWDGVVLPQRRTLRLVQTLGLSGGHALSIEGGIGQFLSLGGSWEWSRDGWFLSSEAAIRDDGNVARLGRDPSGQWELAAPRDKFRPELAMQIQRDLPVAGLGLTRLSLEWVESGDGLSVRQSREMAQAIQELASIPMPSITGGRARQILGEFARSSPWIDGYAHRLLVRWGSVESLSWGGGLNALWIGPTEGVLVQADLHRSLGRRVTLESAITALAWARPGSLVGHLPDKVQVRAGMRWSW
jgi:hypothetical protein